MYQHYMKNNKMKCKLPEIKRQSWRISMEPDINGQNNLTVKHLLFPKKCKCFFRNECTYH